MRPKKQVLSALGNSNWLPVDFRGADFGIGIGVNISSGATLTYSIQHTFDDVYNAQDVTIARTTTTATATFKESHGKVTGDSINVIGTREDNLAGVFDIASTPSDTTLTYTVADTGSAAENAKAVVYSVYEHDSLTGLSVAADGGYTLPPSAIRLIVSAYTDGNVTANYNFLSLGS